MSTFSFEAILAAVLDEANAKGWFDLTQEINRNTLLGDYREIPIRRVRCSLTVLCFRHMADGSAGKIARLLHRDRSTITHILKIAARRDVEILTPFVAAVEARLMRVNRMGQHILSRPHDDELQTPEGVPFQ